MTGKGKGKKVADVALDENALKKTKSNGTAYKPELKVLIQTMVSNLKAMKIEDSLTEEVKNSSLYLNNSIFQNNFDNIIQICEEFMSKHYSDLDDKRTKFAQFYNYDIQSLDLIVKDDRSLEMTRDKVLKYHADTSKKLKERKEFLETQKLLIEQQMTLLEWSLKHVEIEMLENNPTYEIYDMIKKKAIEIKGTDTASLGSLYFLLNHDEAPKLIAKNNSPPQKGSSSSIFQGTPE